MPMEKIFKGTGKQRKEPEGPVSLGLAAHTLPLLTAGVLSPARLSVPLPVPSCVRCRHVRFHTTVISLLQKTTFNLGWVLLSPYYS